MTIHVRRRLTLEPCLPRPAKEPPVGPGWIHEIKHDGFRILARRDKERVRLFTRHGTDFTSRYPKVAAAVGSLPVRSCALDGEAIAVNQDGLSVFNLLRYRQNDNAVVLCAFDLIELDGEDLRWQPLERRKTVLADLLRGTSAPLLSSQIPQSFAANAFNVFQRSMHQFEIVRLCVLWDSAEHVCALGCEGIVSKRLGSPYRSGRVDHWLFEDGRTVTVEMRVEGDVVGVKLQQIKEVPEHVRHFGFRPLNACDAS
jgi:bifunctional non-homologous end joining protein LigD